MAPMEHPNELLPAYALDSLEREEATEVVRHLAACRLCQDELEVYKSVVHQLALAVPPAEPPPQLRQRLLDEVGGSRRGAVAVGRGTGRASWRRPLAARWRWQAALLLLLIVLAVSNLFLWQQFNRLRQEAPPRPVVSLSGTEVAPQASGVLVFTTDGRQATLIVEGMPSLAAEQQYQLWLIQNGQRSDGGVFSVDPAGYHTMPVVALRSMAEYTAFGVTIEPAGGSPGPTGPRVLGGAR
jgi:anti-sigma-K factor RskA